MKKYKDSISIGDKKFELVESFLNDRDFYEERNFSRKYLSSVFLSISKNNPIKIQPLERISSSLSNLRDRKIKFDFSLINSRINTLEKKVNFIQEYSDSLLESSADLEKSIESEIEELEIKYSQKADNVHVNNFTKEKDKSGFRNKNVFRTDFKSLMPFEKKHLMESFFNMGVSFPLKSQEVYEVSNCIILDERTNVGDTLGKIFPNENPFDIFRKNKIFKYALVKSNKDTTARKYKRKTKYDSYPYNLIPTLTLKLELESYVNINYLKISPVSLQGFSLNRLLYRKDGAFVEVQINQKEVGNKYYVFFETFSTSEIILEFEQTSCIENNRVIVSDKESYYLNETLRIGEFVSRVEENYEDITGYIYDLSIKHMEIGKITFESKGIICSKPIDVENLLSSRTKISASHFGDSFFVESYLGIHLNNLEDSLILQEMVPLPDSKKTQHEYLDLRENIGRVKLYPDLNKNLIKDRLTFNDTNISTDMDGVVTGHSNEIPMEQGFPPYFMGVNPMLTPSGTKFFTLPQDSKDITICYKKDFSIEIFQIEEIPPNKTSYKYIVDISDGEETATETKVVDFFNKYNVFVYYYNNQNTFFKVFENERELILGQDYEYSLDEKSSWSSTFPKKEYFLKNKDEKIAGSFYVRIFNPNPEKEYSIMYDIDKSQSLVKNKQVYLINEKLRLGKELRENYGYVQNIIICRNSSNDSEEISLIEKYQNVIFENELKQKKEKRIDLNFSLEKSRRGNLI